MKTWYSIYIFAVLAFGSTLICSGDEQNTGEQLPLPPTLPPTALPNATLGVARLVGPTPLSINDQARFINREISWLRFNERVLDEASNPSHPLMERVRFLSISANNLDEFYMVRVAGLKGQAQAGVNSLSPDGLTPPQQLIGIHRRAGKLVRDQQAVWRRLRNELREASVDVVTIDALDDRERAWLKEHFENSIFPQLTPMSIDPAHPFPFLANKGFGIALQLFREFDSRHIEGLLLFPQFMPRFIRLPNFGNKTLGSLQQMAVEADVPRGNEEILRGYLSSRNEDVPRANLEDDDNEPQRYPVRFVLLEHVVLQHTNDLFPGFVVQKHGMFRVLRDSEVEIDEEAADLMRTFETALKRRKRGHVIQLAVDSHMSSDLARFLRDRFDIKDEDVFFVDGMVGVGDVKQVIVDDRPELQFTPYMPRYPERIKDFGGDLFAAIRAKDLVVHHPFETFDVVVQFVRQAARDPNVLAIKQTLYRTSHDSPIVKALIAAAEDGKSVTALIELKARFDEEANIRYAQDMERAGVQVVYGFLELKTHAKVSLVVRKEGLGLKSYVHFGSGNYHPVTAKIYTDISYFTCDPALTRDAAKMFNYMTGYATPTRLEKIAVAPVTLRRTIVQLVEKEMENARQGKPAEIWAKMNALVDPEIIDVLYLASRAGVKIELVVRGMCSLRPGVPGLSENIRVKSIVGRFLEHSRIVVFANGHQLPSPTAKVFMSSADWMTRNLDWRVEQFVPLENPTVHEQVMEQIMSANLKDTEQSWALQPEGEYQRFPQTNASFGFNAHNYFMTHTSLSGRGTHKDDEDLLRWSLPSTMLEGDEDHAPRMHRNMDQDM